MRSLMQYVLTRTQKLALVLLALLVLLAGWYVGIYTPIQDRIRAAAQKESDTEDVGCEAKTDM